MSGERPQSISIPGLDLFYALYTIILAFGVQEAFSALYKHLPFRDDYFDILKSWEIIFSSLLISFAILLIVVRFFWSTANIRRGLGPEDTVQSGKARFLILLHLPCLLIQGIFILFVCMSFVDFLDKRISFENLILWFVITTGWNALWLLILTRGQLSAQPEGVWIKNNTLFVLIGIAIYFLGAQCLGERAGTIIFFSYSIISSIYDLYKTSQWYLTNMGK